MSKYTKKLNKKNRYKKKRYKKTKKYKFQGGTSSIICSNNCYKIAVLPVLFHAFTNNNEICGCAIKYKDKFQLYREYNDGGKGYCYYTNQYNIIWHTHPYSSKPYPSLTDLLKVIKYQHTISFIFCIFGLWTITFKGINVTAIDNIDKKLKKKNNPEHIYYFSTNRGMQPTAKALYNYIQDVKEIFNNELGFVNSILGFELTFNYWKNHPRLPSMSEKIPDIPNDHIALSHYFTPINPEELFY